MTRQEQEKYLRLKLSPNEIIIYRDGQFAEVRKSNPQYRVRPKILGIGLNIYWHKISSELLLLKSTGIRVDVFKPFPLILIHTPFGLKFFDSLAKTRPAKVYARLNVYLMPIITVVCNNIDWGGHCKYCIKRGSQRIRERLRSTGKSPLTWAEPYVTSCVYSYSINR